MPFQAPPLPSFQTNIPQMPDVLSQVGKFVQLKNLMGQQQLLPLEVQQETEKAKQAALTTQTQQMELDSRKAMMQAIASGELNKYAGVGTPDGSGFDAAGAYQHLITKGVRPEEASQYTNSWLTIGKNQAEISKTLGQAGEAQQKIRETTLKQVASKLGDIGDQPLDKATQALDAFRQDLVKNPKAYPGLTQQELSELYAADLTHLDALEGHIGIAAQVADFHKSKAEAAKAGVEASEAEAASRGELTPKMQREQANKIAVAEAEGRARANIEHEFATKNNAALANVPTHLVTPATAAAEKANKEYADAKSVSDRMNATMDAAKKGNVVSYQIIPQEGTLQLTTSQGVHRINRTEIEQYEGGGSLWQRLEGHLGKALTGKSIPDSVLQDMAEIQKIQAEGSRSRYENTLASINQTYGSKFQAVEMKGLGGGGGGGKEMIRARDPQGKLHEAPKGTALPPGWKLEK